MYEYRTEDDLYAPGTDPSQSLNEMAEDGWELVTAFEWTSDAGFKHTRYIFRHALRGSNEG